MKLKDTREVSRHTIRSNCIDLSNQLASHRLLKALISFSLHKPLAPGLFPHPPPDATEMQLPLGPSKHSNGHGSFSFHEWENNDLWRSETAVL